MRASVHIASLSLALVGLSMAADGHAAMDRRYTNIPPEALGPALRTLATELKFQIVYASRDVAFLKTQGAVGDFSPNEALKEVLSGTGLTYRYVDEGTVTVVPLASSTAPSARSPQASLNQSEKAQRSFSQPFRMAAVGEGQAPGSSALTASSGADQQNGQFAVLQEVVVTAQLRHERAVDVPISLSVIDASTIAATGATSLDDLQFTVPGLTSASYTPGGANFIELRGVSDSNIGSPTVGRYFDEMPINLQANGTGLDVRFLDLQRVEVLRGPQPTLYGDGAMGGVIRYVPAPPSLAREPSGAISADYTSVDGGRPGWLTHGHFDFSLIPGRIGLRLAAWHEQDGGWIDREPTGQKNINSNTIDTVRATLLAKLTDRTELKLLWQHGSTHAPNQNFGTDDVTRSLVPSYNDTDSDFLEAVLSADLGFAKLVETPDFLRFRLNQQFDLSSFYVPYLGLLGFPPGYVTEIGLTSDSDANIFYNELRLMSENSGPWSWAAGFDFKNSRLTGGAGTPTSPNPLPFSLISTYDNQPEKTQALWAEVGYAFDDRWHASLGARYFRDHLGSIGNAVEFGAPSNYALNAVFTSTDPRFDLRYAIDPAWNVYFNVGKGFRGGGVNVADPSSPTYAPDSLWTEEIGSKGLFLRRKLEVNADVYYNDWKGVQESATFPNGLSATVNSGVVKGVGYDLDATLRPLAGLQIGATMGWNNMAYREAAPNLSHAVGDPPDFAVRQSWSAFLGYSHPVWVSTGASVYGRVDFQHSNRALYTLRTPPYVSFSEMPPRDLLNLRVGLSLDHYDISVYADNALNSRTPIIQGPFGPITESIEMRPRLYGVTLRATF